MNFHSRFWLISVAGLLIVLAALCACGDDDDDDDPEDPTCERDTELVFDAQIDWNGDDLFFRYWLDENEENFLSGRVQDLNTGVEYAALGLTQGKNSYLLSFSPGKSFENYTCPQSLSLTLDVKNLEGVMTLYCGLESLDQWTASAQVLCDETGITLDNP